MWRKISRFPDRYDTKLNLGYVLECIKPILASFYTQIWLTVTCASKKLSNWLYATCVFTHSKPSGLDLNKTLALLNKKFCIFISFELCKKSDVKKNEMFKVMQRCFAPLNKSD